MKVSSKNDHPYFRIYIDDLLHLQFIKEEYIGHQSWKENSTKFCIEYYLKNGNTILSEYTSIEKWKNIIKILEEL